MTREEVIRLIKRELCPIRCENGNSMDKCKARCEYKEAIKALEQEPKTGWWIEKADEYYKAINEKGGGVINTTPYFVDDIACSECLTMFSTIDNETERFEFCPNCGARMEGGD
jgi:hypothetical protein